MRVSQSGASHQDTGTHTCGHSMQRCWVFFLTVSLVWRKMQNHVDSVPPLLPHSGGSVMCFRGEEISFVIYELPNTRLAHNVRSSFDALEIRVIRFTLEKCYKD